MPPDLYSISKNNYIKKLLKKQDYRSSYLNIESTRTRIYPVNQMESGLGRSSDVSNIEAGIIVKPFLPINISTQKRGVMLGNIKNLRLFTKFANKLLFK